jgi:ABC-type antimicrobial peptide transport system permease subunit
VIGVVGDVKESGIVQAVIPQAYFPMVWAFYRPGRPMHLVVKQSGSANAVIESVKRAVREADSSLALFSIRSMREVIENSTTGVRSQTTLLSVFAILALLLAAVGIYGVLSYLMAQRTREFSIRLALGAQRSSLIRLVGREMLVVVGVGIVLGSIGAFVLARSLASMLYGLSPYDPLTLSGAVVAIAITACLACMVPVARTTQVDPALTLRQD